MTYADAVSSLALSTALGALAWNIVRDFVSDRISVRFSITFGELGNIKNSITGTGIFAPAGSLLPDHKFDNPSILVQIINTGRKPICISGVGGHLKSGEELFMSVDGLPKMLQPYEVFSTASSIKPHFLDKIRKDEISNLWAIDTAGGKWSLSVDGWKQLKSTASYITSGKHL